MPTYQDGATRIGVLGQGVKGCLGMLWEGNHPQDNEEGRKGLPMKNLV